MGRYLRAQVGAVLGFLMVLSILYQFDELADVHKPFLLAFLIGRVQGLRYDKLKIAIPHRICLAFRHARLQGQQMLMGDAVGFIKYLAPSVLQSRFRAQHRKLLERIGQILIFLLTGKRKSGLLFPSVTTCR